MPAFAKKERNTEKALEPIGGDYPESSSAPAPAVPMMAAAPAAPAPAPEMDLLSDILGDLIVLQWIIMCVGAN